MTTRLYELLQLRSHEKPLIGYFVLVFLLIGTGLALGRGSMDALFLKRYGFEYLPVMYGLLAVFLSLVSVVYAAYVDRLPAERFMRILCLVLVAGLALNWTLISVFNVELAYPVYFLIYEIASEILLLHAALYLNQNLDTLQAKRLTPLVFAAIQVGTVIGGLLLSGLSHQLGVQNMLLLWCLALLLAFLLITLHHRRSGPSPYYQPGGRRHGGSAQALAHVLQGLKFTRDSELLRAASFALLFMVIAFYILCYSINRIYATTFASEENLSVFLGGLTAVTSTLTLLTQTLVTGRLLNRFGVKRTNLVFPVSGIFCYGALLVSFALPAALIASFARDVLLPAIRRPTRNLFFNALPDYIQGRARAMTLALVLPVALLLASGVLVLTQELGSPLWFLVPGLAASVIYLYFATAMNRAYLAAMLNSLKETLFIPGQQQEALRKDGSRELVDELVRGIDHSDDDIALASAKLLIEAHPHQGVDAVVARIRRAPPALQDRLLQLVGNSASPAVTALCHMLVSHEDRHLEATAATILFRLRDTKARSLLPGFLDSDNPRLIAAAIVGVCRYRDDALRMRADAHWRQLLEDSRAGAVLAGLSIFDDCAKSDAGEQLVRLLQHEHPEVQKGALSALARSCDRPPPGLTSQLESLIHSLDPVVRTCCVRCYRLLPRDQAELLALAALEDGHPRVRDTAMDVLDDGTPQFAEMLAGLIIGNAGSPRAQKALLHALELHGAQVPTLREIADAKISDAVELADTCRKLRATGPYNKAGRLLAMVLDERRAQVIDLALSTVERIEDPQTIRIIRAALQSGDTRSMSSAVEALRNIHDQRLATELGSLLERYERDDRTQPPSAQQLTSLIDWCQRRPDPWLRQCVQYFSDSLTGDESHARPV